MRISIWVAVVSSSSHRVLLARRAPTTRNAGQWNFFGGGMDPGERPMKTAIRELKEEAGIAATRRDLVELGETTTSAKRNILFGMMVDDEFVPSLNGESTHWEWVAVMGLEQRHDLHMPTSLLLGCLSGWLAQFPRLTSVVVESEDEDSTSEDRLPRLLEWSPQRN